MELRKNWFSYFSLILFQVCMAFILISGIEDLGVGTHPFLRCGLVLLGLGTLWAGVHLFSAFAARVGLQTGLSQEKRAVRVAKWVFVFAVLAAGGAARVWAVGYFPLKPASDYQTYYQVAQLLTQGTLAKDGPGLCDYISQFPHVIGFPFILSLLFHITGISLSAGLYLNVAASVLGSFFSYRTARLLGGRIAGLITLLVTSFWPSQILYSGLLASEPMFTCLMMLSVWIAVSLSERKDRKPRNILILCLVLGVLLALAASVRPMTEILLIAVVLVIVPVRNRLPMEKNRAPLLLRAAGKGRMRALIIVVGFLISSQIVSGTVAHTVDRELPGSGVSFGYNLLVGLNISSKGAWNEQDSKLLNDTFSATDSAAAAHKACLDQAILRVKKDPVGIANLMMEKFTLLWKNDDYGYSWDTLFLGQQNTLTPERKSLLDSVKPWNNIYYLVCVFFAAVAGVIFWYRRKENSTQILVLFFLGTAAVHMMLESQNRYHYNILPIFAILGSVAIAEIFRSHIHREESEPVHAAELPHLPPPSPEDQVPAKPIHFDLQKAIEEGHVTVTVTPAYKTNGTDGKKPSPDSGQGTERNAP